ncbi:hypothetical protein WMY93_033087, partial [Mugilogobius chulae]
VREIGRFLDGLRKARTAPAKSLQPAAAMMIGPQLNRETASKPVGVCVLRKLTVCPRAHGVPSPVCGHGGTIDIAVHEVLEGGALKELHRASGNDRGGRRVDRRFTKCMREFFCDGLWEDYEREHPEEFQKFMDDFICFRQADLSRKKRDEVHKTASSKCSQSTPEN